LDATVTSPLDVLCLLFFMAIPFRGAYLKQAYCPAHALIPTVLGEDIAKKSCRPPPSLRFCEGSIGVDESITPKLPLAFFLCFIQLLDSSDEKQLAKPRGCLTAYRN